MKGEMDFSDKWFRKRFRDELQVRTYRMGGETLLEHFTRIVNYLNEHGVTLSASGKMAYDRNLNQNNCTNMPWSHRDEFMALARRFAPDVIKKRGAQPQHNGRVTTPATKNPTKPTTTGWDDFDWSR